MTKEIKFSKLSISAKAELAGALVNDGKYDEAASLLKSLSIKYPRNIDVKFYFGVLYFFQNDYKEAEYYFLKALDINPSHSETLYNLGAVYKKTFRLKDSINAYQNVIEIEKGDTDVYKNAIKKLGEIETEIKINKNLSLDDYVLSSDIFKKAFQLLKLEKYEEAIELINQELKIDQKHVQSLGNIGYAYLKTSNYELAEKYFLEALELDPNYAAAKKNLAILRQGLSES